MAGEHGRLDGHLTGELDAWKGAAFDLTRRALAEHPAIRGWLVHQRARLAHMRHPELGEISAYHFYATKLRYGDLAFDVGANHGDHTGLMLHRGAQVVAIEPQADVAARLAARFPKATVLQTAVSDEPGTAVLHLVPEDDTTASLDPGFVATARPGLFPWSDQERVPVTTLDRLIDAYGEPTLVKIDTEGFEHRVLRGLGRPIKHILFEVHAALSDQAAEAFERLDNLGRYEYSVSPGKSWLFPEGPQSSQRILSNLPAQGDVYARRVG